MTLKARLEELESALPPRTAALRWLSEAHAFGSWPAYARWLVDQPRSAYPLNCVPAQARAAAAAATKGLPRKAAEDATRQALRDALFLVYLVFEVNSETTEAVGTETLRSVALSEGSPSILLEAELATHDPESYAGDYAERWAGRLALERAWLSHLYVAEDARILLERWYLDGRPSLFPELAAEWASLLNDAETLVRVSHRLTPDEPAEGRRRGGRCKPHELDLASLRASLRDRAEAEAIRLVDAARAETLNALGDHAGWIAITRRILGSG
jgi:hypothetical protein